MKRRRCVSVWTTDDDARPRVIRCRHFALPDTDFCENCAETCVREGEVDGGLRCPWCDEFGDFSHLHTEAPADLVDIHGNLGKRVECNSCGCESFVLEARLWLRIQRGLLPEEEV